MHRGPRNMRDDRSGQPIESLAPCSCGRPQVITLTGIILSIIAGVDLFTLFQNLKLGILPIQISSTGHTSPPIPRHPRCPVLNFLYPRDQVGWAKRNPEARGISEDQYVPQASHFWPMIHDLKVAQPRRWDRVHNTNHTPASNCIAENENHMIIIPRGGVKPNPWHSSYETGRPGVRMPYNLEEVELSRDRIHGARRRAQPIRRYLEGSHPRASWKGIRQRRGGMGERRTRRRNRMKQIQVGPNPTRRQNPGRVCPETHETVWNEFRGP
jgi:hypothetical protein